MSPRRPGWDVIAAVAAVAAGGAVGSALRYGVALIWPTTPGGFPWATLVTNLAGCFLIGVLMHLLDARTTHHRLIQPFVGTGLLGGFTTFSAYAVEGRSLLAAGRIALAAVYLAGTLLGALVAVRIGVRAARQLTPAPAGRST
ncbi:MAG: chromosome condensation protein CrcB [Actinobacteria bacterium]|nr:MAG: chromosome condensation protein CrcB [Actinomycetota bacterium]